MDLNNSPPLAPKHKRLFALKSQAKPPPDSNSKADENPPGLKTLPNALARAGRLRGRNTFIPSSPLYDKRGYFQEGFGFFEIPTRRRPRGLKNSRTRMLS